MNNLQFFKNPEFGAIRAVTINNEPWFIASDICKVLELNNPTMVVQRLDNDEKSKLNLGLSGGDTNCINEYGLYNLILASRKKEAKTFKRWITHEVLPSIRKNGGYIAGQESLSDEELLEKAVLVAQRKIAERDAVIARQQEQIKQDKPKTLFADAVAASHTSILVGEFAKILQQNGMSIGANRLFQKLREEGYLIKRKGTDWNMPTQRSMEMGLFEIKESSRLDSNGCNIITRTPKVTGHGQIYFVNRYVRKVVEA